MSQLGFFMESKLKVIKIIYLKKKMGMEGCFVIDAMGRIGGLILL